MKADYSDLVSTTEQHSRLSVELDGLLKDERDAKFLLLQKESDVRKVHFQAMASKEISQAYFRELLKDQTFDEMVDYERAKTERTIKANQLSAVREQLYTQKKIMSI